MTRQLLRFLSLAGLLVLALRGGDISADEFALVRPVDGKPFQARIANIDADWKITFDDGKHKRSIAASDLIDWGAHSERLGKPQILLADRGILCADVLRVTDHHVTVESRLCGLNRLPLEHIRGIIFRPPSDVLLRDRLVLEILAAKGGDQLLLVNGDRLSGTLVHPRSPKIGPQRDSDVDHRFRLDIEGSEVVLPREKILAVVFNPALVDVPKPSQQHVLVGLSDGSYVTVDQIDTKPEGLELKLPGKMRLDVLADDPAKPFGAITMLRTSTGRVQYVSDLKPIRYKHIPFLERSWRYGNDENVLGGRLRSGGKLYTKGIGMHSRSWLAYQLNGKYSRFEAELAIDEAAKQNGSVIFHVYVDLGEGLKLVEKTGVIRGGQAAQAIAVDVSDAQKMVLLVEFADKGDQWDHANWLNARLVR